MTPALTPAELAAAREAWARVAVRLAARGRMRLSRTGRKFERRGERDVTVELPSHVAAVLLYDALGCAPVFVVDLDSSKADASVVDADHAAIVQLLDEAGLAARFSDRSVSGGRHLYVPLCTPVPHFEARQVAIALEELFATVDAMPMRGATEGCIRPPGAWHRHGGHQVLDEPIEAAEAALDQPNDDDAWRRFVDLVTTKTADGRHNTPRTPATHEPVALTPLRPAYHNVAQASPLSSPPAGPGEIEDQLEPLHGWSEPSADYQHIARTGVYDPARYPRRDGKPTTPSDVRQRVIWGCVAAGWSFGDVVRRVHDGTWPGLASFYARYSDGQRHGALQHDWRRAIAHERRRRQGAGEREHASKSNRGTSVRTTTTRGRKTQAGGSQGPAQNEQAPARTRSEVERFVREWLVAVELLHGPATDLTLRSLLVALAQMAILTGRTDFEVGNRGLAVAAATDNGTISRHLKRLLAEPSDRALVDHVQQARGVRAHVIALRIPALLAPACAARPWRRGRIHGIRAPFRELGRAAAFVYDVLEQLDAPAGGRDIAARARLSPAATYEALQVLAAWGLATNTSTGWILGDASLAHLAEAFGVDDAVRAQIERYRADRRTWWNWLVGRGLLDSSWVTARTTPPPQPEPPPPPPRWSDDTSLVELLQRELGAEVIELAG